MCGIYGYVGPSVEIVPLVADALRTMEYRGYDSWGIAWDAGDRFSSIKRTGRVPHHIPTDPSSTIAIGHTRWATHGGVTDANAHPHFDSANQIGVVHNGVIENARELKESLLSDSLFRSDTDSEIVPHLIHREMESGLPFPDAVSSAFRMLHGSSAIVAADRNSDTIAAITSRSPLRLGHRRDGWELASDPLALASSCDEIAVIPDGHLLVIEHESVSMTNLDSGEHEDLRWEAVPHEAAVSRGNFDHFTIKEIHDQPAVIRRLAADSTCLEALAEAVRSHKHILLTGCGSAYYAASLGAEWLARSTRTWIDVIPASELTERTRNRGEDTLVIALTQSGETADVVDAIHIARGWGASTATIVNVESSSVASMVDIVVPILAGVERSVLATKSFMAMAVRLLQLAKALDTGDSSLPDDLSNAADAIEMALEDTLVSRLVGLIKDQEHVIVLGKGFARPVAMEAALKIKEGSYVHAEAFLTGELKHGPLALVTLGTPCIAFATNQEELSSARIAAQEVSSRGGYTIGVGEFEEGDCSAILSPRCTGAGVPLVELAISQRLAYELTVARGIDPDFPRNLAKSVTVR